MEAMQAASGVLLQGPAAALEARPQAERPVRPGSPIRELTSFQPSEIWLIEVKKLRRQKPACLADQALDLIEQASYQVLEQELLFIEKINSLLRRGALIDTGYRPIEVHRIVMEHELDEHSKLDRGIGFIQGLMSYGRERGTQFLEKRHQRLASWAGVCLSRQSDRQPFPSPYRHLGAGSGFFRPPAPGSEASQPKDRDSCPSGSWRSALCVASMTWPEIGLCRKGWPQSQSMQTRELNPTTTRYVP